MSPHHFFDVQRIVLKGGDWQHARHIGLDFGAQWASPCHFLRTLEKRWQWPTRAIVAPPPRVQTSLGFSRQGLERAGVPRHVLSCFALKAPAFHAGAALRAARHLGAVGLEAPGAWDPRFALGTLDAVISLHATDEAELERAVQTIRDAAAGAEVQLTELQSARRLPPHPNHAVGQAVGQTTMDGDRPGREMWVHFGYRDGLARVGIRGWSSAQALASCQPASVHEAGEFVLGHRQDSGGTPWIAGPGQRVWPAPLRSFFHNGSFGVLQQIEQHVSAFDDFVARAAAAQKIDPDELKAKLCGRHPDGRPVGAPGGRPDADFDYADDPSGLKCPFGAHVRRMNPREVDLGTSDRPSLAHASRARPLLRRGLPYGPAAWNGARPDGPKRGLMAQFFCASIEDQYEHLVGQWADRVPLGSPDRGGARDPFIGAHESIDGPFEIPRPDRQPSVLLNGLQPFTCTRGIAYLFYPSQTTLSGIARSEPWLERDEGVA